VKNDLNKFLLVVLEVNETNVLKRVTLRSLLYNEHVVLDNKTTTMNIGSLKYK